MHVFIRLAGCPSSGGRPSYRIVPVPRRTAGTLPIRAKRLRSRAVLNKNTQKMDKSVQLGSFFVGPRIRRSAKIKQNPVERMFNGVSVPRTGITGLLRVVSRFHNYMTCRCSVLALCYQRLCFITDIRSCRRSCIALVVCCEERMAFQDFSILFC